MPDDTANRTLATLIRAEQIRHIYRNMPMMLFNNIAAPLLMLYLWWDTVDHFMMLAWFATMLVVVLARGTTYLAYLRVKPAPEQAAKWGYFLIVTTFASGCLWGAAGMEMSDPGKPLQFSIILLFLYAFGAGGVISFSPFLPVFYAFFFPSMLPFVVASFARGTEVNIAAAIGALMFVSSLSIFARNQNKVFRESLLLRFENIDLVKALTAEKESAERANAAKTRFLAAASHDLRQPLHAIGLFISALGEMVRGAPARKLVRQLSESTESLRGLLNALLDISRLDAGVIQPRITSLSLQELFERLAHDHSAPAAEKKIEITFAPTQAWVQCDAILLERILRNLISNAIRYTERGKVLVGCRRRGDQIRIEVHDTGIGIAEHELGNIFHEFYQIDNPERDRNKGLGLGLAIAQRLARLLGHRIEVVSTPGKGSRFALTIPRSAAEEDAGEPVATPRPDRLKNARVVVIDDEKDIRDAMQVLLEGWGCNAVLADSGATAMAALARQAQPPHVIIADYRLRNHETGVTAIRDLHAKYQHTIPAIIITGDTAPDRIREAEASGYHLLHKPLAPARLRALLTHLLPGA